jgi:glycosyltransferase involved in cell wall biosynthesis
MRILIVNHYSGSPEFGMEYRHFHLAREWQALGHDVRIIASRFSHLRMLKQPDVPPGRWIDHGGIPHRWLAGCPYAGNGIQRLFNMLGFAAELWTHAPRFARRHKPDLVLASSPHPFVAYGAARLARAANAKLVFEIRDLWPMSLTELGAMSPAHPFVGMLDRAEAYGCTHADKVISLLPCVHDYMAGRAVDREKWSWLPNGFDPVEYAGAPEPLDAPLEELLLSLRAGGKFIVGYAGSHAAANSLDALLDAAALLPASAFAFVLVGSGHDKARLERRVQEEHLRNVHLCPPMPKDRVRGFLAGVDAAYLGAPKSPLYRFGVAPNKLTDYMMAGVPVVYAIDAGNDPVSEAGCGVSAPPGNAAALAAAIERLARMPEQDRQALGARGRGYAERHHAYPRLARRFLESIHTRGGAQHGAA